MNLNKPTIMYVDSEEFSSHRKQLIEMFHANGHSKGAIIYMSEMAREERFGLGDIDFYQDGLFYWLTGWESADSALLIDLAKKESILYIPAYDDDYEIWHGAIPSEQYVKSVTSVDRVKFTNKLESDLSNFDQLYSADGQFFDADDGKLMHYAGLLRMVKSPKEIETLRKAATITSDAIVTVMQKIEPGWKELDVDAEFTYYGAKQGATNKSFQTIAASGQNSVYLHSCANKGVCNDGDLLLLDCGFFYKHYAGDVTRTFPVNGKFSEDQAHVYSLMLSLQESLVNAVKPGVTLGELQGMMNLGIFKICNELGIANQHANPKIIGDLFTPHSVSHHIGCNCHDLSADRQHKLRPGMLISIEPGIYFNKTRLERMRDCKYVNIDVAIRYANSVAGIRIEDDVLVTEAGNEVLSKCPKSIEAIEAIMKH